MIQAGDLVIDRDRYLVTVDGEPVRLTFMEFNALWAILAQSGKVVTYDALAEALWGKPVPHARRRLAVIISRIRSKLGVAADVIDTVTRVGYRMAPAMGG
jgi:DNA-binding response OmpR family regulator